MDGELLEVGAAGDSPVNATQSDGRIAGHQDDQRGGELLPPCPGGSGPIPSGSNMVSAASSRPGQHPPARPGGRDGSPAGTPCVLHAATVASRLVRAAVCNELGPPSVLRVEERPDPQPGPGEVAVAVEAAGVNYVDGLFVAGRYQMKPSLPFVPGSEVAGHVVAVGPDVRGVALGDRVLASVGLGGFANSVVVPKPTRPSRCPRGWTWPWAATFTQSYSTSLFALRDRARAGAR